MSVPYDELAARLHHAAATITQMADLVAKEYPGDEGALSLRREVRESTALLVDGVPDTREEVAS